MSVNIGSVPLLRQIQAERTGKPLSASRKSKIRTALLKGEKLSNRTVPKRFGVSITALNDAIVDLKRVGYEVSRSESARTGSVFWIENLDHEPTTDSGSTRSPRKPRRPARSAVRAQVPDREEEQDQHVPLVFGSTLTVTLQRLDPDGVVRYGIQNEKGTWIVRVEGFES